jgi:hypothetical protein
VGARKSRALYADSVFINCPFDDEYLPVFRAIVFTVAACGFVPRCTLEHEDASQVRIRKIYRLIKQSAFGIHDVSRTELDAENHLPRFNMPLELGVFLGAKKFGRSKHANKRCLVLDRDRFRFQKFISDIAGQDIKAHGNRPQDAIRAVRDWLRNALRTKSIPSGSLLSADYDRLTEDLPELCEAVRLNPSDLTFTDFYGLVFDWLAANR